MSKLNKRKLKEQEDLAKYLNKQTSREEIKTIMESEVFHSFLKHVENRFTALYPVRSEIEHVQQANIYSVNGVKEFIEMLESEANSLVFEPPAVDDDEDPLKDFAS
jgi:hypothetical protein